MLRKFVTALVIGSVLAVGGGAAASGATLDTPQVTASQAAILEGGSSIITATGLGDAETVQFTVDRPSGWALDPGVATVIDGEATTLFTGIAPGYYTVSLLVDGVVAATTSLDVQRFDPKMGTNQPVIAVGGRSMIWASGLGAASTVMFIASDSDNATVDPHQATVVGGRSLTVFRATAPGTYTVTGMIADSSIGSLTITVIDGPSPALSATPATITVGQTSTLTVTGLFGDAPATFGLYGGVSASGEPAIGTITPNPAPVSDGSATATFSATVPGEYTISVGDGASRPYASIVITVTAAAPAAFPPTTVPASSSAKRLADSGGELNVVALGLGMAAALTGGLLMVLGRRRARQH